MKDTLVDKHTNIAIGSFRNAGDIRRYLPTDLYNAIFDEIPDGLDVTKLITVNKNKANFNNGAFGHAYDDVLKLSMMLREFSELQPEVFYDQVCLPLVNHSYDVVENFFGTENVLLVPNCTFGMRCIAELLIREQRHSNVACLYPIYGATLKLLKYYESNGFIDALTTISPGDNPLIEEEEFTFIQTLEEAYNIRQFTILFCDEIASQSGRILPLDAIADFCQARGIRLVVDGTQSCQLFFGNKKDVLQKVDYFVMSTHKWLGNSKTCGVIRYKNEPPSPPAISFGWEPDTAKRPSIQKIRAQYTWQGMMDSYVSYIALAKALQIFRKYGEEQFFKSSALLKKGLSQHLNVQSLLPERDRVLNIFELENSQFEPLKDLNKIQETLQEYGIFISVKKFGQDCSGVTVDGQKLTNGSKSSPMKSNSPRNGEKNTDISRNGDSNDGPSCSLKPVHNFYLRVSCWSFNNDDDFQTLALTFNNNLKLSTTSNAALRQQFLFTYELYEKLFSTLKTKAFFIRAERLRHHLIFYYGHTAVFFINKLVVSGNLHPSHRFDPRLESSLSVGVDEMKWDDLLEDNYDWSGLSEPELEKYLEKVQEYRSWVKKLVLKLIDENPIVNPIVPGSLHWILLMGIEHEKIHLETSAAIISQVSIELIKKKHDFNYPTYWKGKQYISSKNNNKQNTTALTPNHVPLNNLVPIPGGTVLMGKAHLEQDIYGWDNEYGSEKKVLEPFEASQMLVSNAEYLKFVQDGGYKDEGEKWWSPEGWRYVKDLNITGPRFWIGQTHYRAMLEEIPMPWDLPVETNNLEAEAFCNWKSEQLGKEVRLISHEESFLMRQTALNESSNHNLHKYASPTPVNLYGGVINGQNVYDISGNVWRHSVSVLTVMDGFKTDPFYNDFTLPTIDGFHNHILGGSWISLGNCANVNARYGFRRHFYQYAGIRYVASKNTYHNRVLKMFDEVKTTKYITENYSDFTADTLVEKKPVENWPKIFGQKASGVVNEQTKGNNAVKLFVAYGGAGRTTLEMLRSCQNLCIDHTDATANKLQVLECLLQESRIQWYQQLEGKITEAMEYHLNQDETPDSLLTNKNNTVAYWQADYGNIRPQLDGYDVIVADIRQKDGADELMHITGRLKAGGVLILGSIDNTNDEVQNGSKHSISVLKKYFTRLGEQSGNTEFPHIYRETRNKHQYAISYFSVWKKNTAEQIRLEDLKNSGSIPSSNDVSTTADYYEDKNILTSYDAFHFGEGLLSVKNFPLRMGEVIIESCKKFNCPMKTALDAGCGPGRTAMELCAEFEKVEGYDYSQGFIDMMIEQKEKRKLNNLIAYQGDSHKQDEICHEKKFDMIFGCNLIDRLHSPEIWVQQSKAMLSPGGLLIISSPYTWKPEHTAAEKYIGGFKKDGEDRFTVDGLREMLSPELVLLEERKVPFVIPDADGTYQYTYSNCTVFGAPRK